MSLHAPSVDFVAICVVSLFTIINPLGATPFFLAHTSETSPAEAEIVARRASLACALVLIFFAVAGETLFRWMGITLYSRLYVGARHGPRSQPTIPLLAGPGSISTVIVLISRGRNWVEDLVVLLSVVVVSAVTYIVLRHSSALLRILGASGVRVMTRLMGFLLVGISVQFVINGIKEILPILSPQEIASASSFFIW